MNLSQVDVLAIVVSDRNAELFAVFCRDNGLYLYDKSTDSLKQLAIVDGIVLLDKPIKLYFHTPYIGVTENFGLNAAVINLNTGATQLFRREDYHADVSSYSMAFIERQGRTLLVHQTQWNRLDITDLQDGRLLTPREISIEEIEPEKRLPGTAPRYNRLNYMDYFHSQLLVSPQFGRILDNGWMWAPVDNIRCIEVETFLTGYEFSTIAVEYTNGYNWDRPCAFLDENRFVIAVDRPSEDYYDQDELDAYLPRTLEFYQFSDIDLAEKRLQPYKIVNSGLFSHNEYGEISGELYYDRDYKTLIAIGDKGVVIVDTDGNKLYDNPHMLMVEQKVEGKVKKPLFQWIYQPDWHIFYCYHADKKMVEVVEYQKLVINDSVTL
ncbi:hypothetical protein [Budvicia aquatica]|uniref:hypothetical protein n=1 Tax=Budvicia aquatica TaxID=82979 RepID=UPI0020884FB3|nr:hypothetical protein [Budvicia aquatica]GKX49988.1 hypothetical protein SOASR029_02970 [Budvicia aquatica]